MKKIISMLLLVAMILSIMSLTNIISFAEPSENLLINGGFEDGITEEWQYMTKAEDEMFEESEDAYEGEMSCLVTGRTAAWSSPVQNITSIIKEWGKGTYIVSAYVKLSNEEDENAKTSMQIVSSYIKDGTKVWLTSKSTTVNCKEYKKIEGEIYVDFEESYDVGELYIQGVGSKHFDFYLDDFYLAKKDGVKTPITEPTPMPLDKIENRAEETLVGAIRWDAWVNPQEKWGEAGVKPEDYIGAQVARSLGQAKYHYRAPFFTIVKSENEITFPDYTQEIFDEEMRYAIEAGIDYFMYCWYNDDDIMSSARKYHVNSKYKNDVKMCAMINIASLSKDDYDYWLDNFKLDCWQKVDGNRPLVYADNMADARYNTYVINKFRNKCMEAGLGNPYIIGLTTFGATPENVKGFGLDAISDYASGGGVDAGEFKDLAYDIWLEWYERKAKGVNVVPLVSTGWDRRPRIDFPVTWEGPTKNKLDFYNTATPQEIADHLQQALDFAKNNADASPANTVLIYAWNEHDEGGWICPTLLDDDGDGIPTKRSDGTNARDTRRLQAIQKVLRPDAEWTLDKDVTLDETYIVPNYQTAPPEGSLATETPKATEPPVNNDNDADYTFIIIGASVGVVVVAGIVTIILVAKKKKDITKTEE